MTLSSILLQTVKPLAATKPPRLPTNEKLGSLDFRLFLTQRLEKAIPPESTATTTVGAVTKTSETIFDIPFVPTVTQRVL